MGVKDTNVTPSLTSWPTRKALGGKPSTAINALPCPVVDAMTPIRLYCALFWGVFEGTVSAWPKALATVGSDWLGAMGALARPTTGKAVGAVNSKPQYTTPPAAVAQIKADKKPGQPNRFMFLI